MSAIGERVEVEELKLVYHNIFASTHLPAVAVVMIVAILWPAGGSPVLAAWGAVTLFAVLLFGYRAWRRRPVADGLLMRRHFALENTVQGLCWAAMPWVLPQPDRLASDALSIALILAGATIQLATTALVPAALLGFCAVTLSSLSAWLLLKDDPAFHVLGLLALGYEVTLVVLGQRTRSAIRTSIALRFENLDLIDQLRAEREVARSAQRDAQRANAEKSRFLAAASHDLRQPLHAQGLFMDVLGRAGLNAEQAELLARARAAWQSSTELLDTLLDYARIEGGRIEARPRSFALQEILVRLEREFGPQADDKGIVYRGRDTTLSVHADPGLTERILRNLVSNAVRYTRRGGVLVAARRRNRQACLEVWDTGPGVAPEDRQRIFDEFIQLANPQRDRRQGLGLGLAIVRRLSGLLGTEVTVDSVPGRGSVFRLCLPLATLLPEGRTAPEPVAASALHGLDILLVEDDPTVREGTEALLSGLGACCTAVVNADEARAAIGNGWQPDLILSDYRLPGDTDGCALIAELRQTLGRSLPAILITGDTTPDHRDQATRGRVTVLHKPISAGDLARAILRLNARS